MKNRMYRQMCCCCCMMAMTGRNMSDQHNINKYKYKERQEYEAFSIDNSIDFRVAA